MTLIIKVDSHSQQDSNSTIVKLRCPACRQRGTFDILLAKDIWIQKSQHHHIAGGLRGCPDPDCKTLVFFIQDRISGKVIVSYPSERIEFDTTDIPATVLNAFEESLTCHANLCYVAAAIMVRKTLEEICRERGATGSNLKKRLETLRTKIVLPQELLDGLDDLRLLGNDAAHIESHEYDKVGEEEVEVGIEITKEVLKAVYQYTALIGRLQKLKKPTS